jgi:hypothetical protein
MDVRDVPGTVMDGSLPKRARTGFAVAVLDELDIPDAMRLST